jgi:IS6 family transposase
MLTANRDIDAAKRFFKKALSSPHNQSPRVITVDKNAAYLPAIHNIIEQDHRFIKNITKPILGF